MQGSVQVPAEYFLKMAKHDYQDWRKALPREFYQNSIDAFAEAIHVESNKTNRTITIEDDGCGMSQEVLLDKLLVLGGTYKPDGGVGAFGKAKELLFFSWPEYSIRTHGILVAGKGADFELNRTSPYLNGTSVQITIPESEDFDLVVRAFFHVALKMRSSTKILINDNEASGGDRIGGLVRREDWLSIYQIKKRESEYASVRVGGVWMFDKWIGRGFGTLSFEIDRSSLEALTSNRDGLKQEYSAKMQQLMADLLINKVSALRPKPQMVYEKIKGDGAVKVHPGDFSGVVTSFGLQAHVDTAEFMRELGNRGIEISEILITRVNDAQIEKVGTEVMASKLAMIAYQPDFVIKHRGDRGQFVESNKGQVLAKMWTEVLRQVMLDNGIHTEFVAGFTFESRDLDAQLVELDGLETFLVNPRTLCRIAGLSKAPMKNRKLLVRDLKSRACHEIAHRREKNHDEKFILEFHKIEEHTWTSDRQYQQIQKIR